MPSHESLYSFTIPSIHDDAVLDCRIYHPSVLSRLQSGQAENKTQWRHRGVVMAHPYAPMGGSYDDRVVGIVVEEYLKLDFVVGTFNFRGAHGSKARTSWSGKAEVDDYISFAAFFMHYLSYLLPFPSADAIFAPEQSPISGPRDVQVRHQYNLSQTSTKEGSLVLLGGYSYGSLILRNLPPVPSILLPFSEPAPGTAAAEILLRAHRLADEGNLGWINHARSHARDGRKRGGPGVVMGGEETSPEKRRRSRETMRRTMDGEGGGKRSLDVGSRLRSLSHKRSTRKDAPPKTPPEQENKGTGTTIVMPEVRYLLISPLTPPVSTLVAPGLGQRFWSREKEAREVVGMHATLAIFGDQDIFSSAKRTRDWAEKMGTGFKSQFSSAEIAGAGHFWHEDGVEEKLRAALRGWDGAVP